MTREANLGQLSAIPKRSRLANFGIVGQDLETNYPKEIIMNQLKAITLSVCLGVFCSSASGRGIATLTTLGESASNSISIASDQSFFLRTAKSSIGNNGCQIFVKRDGVTAIYSEDAFKVNDSQYTPDITFAGPAVIELRTINTATWAMLTLEI